MEDELSYELRVQSCCGGDDNSVTSLSLHMLVADAFVPVELSNAMPPYRIFVMSTILCQHTYLRLNATERGLALDAVYGEVTLRARQFQVTLVDARFRASLRSGGASADDVAFIAERMRTCPVSRNLGAAEKRTALVFTSREPRPPGLSD